jgi:hypothetical protein
VVRGLFEQLAPPPPPAAAAAAGGDGGGGAAAGGGDGAAAGGANANDKAAEAAAEADKADPVRVNLRALLESSDDEDDVRGAGVDQGVDQAAEEAAAAAAEAERKAEAAQRQWEARAGMVCCDVLFWKPDWVCRLMQEGYYLDEEDMR